MEKQASNSRSWFTTVRTIAAWIVIPAFISMFVAQNVITAMNPRGSGPWPAALPRPASFDMWLQIRNTSFLIALVAGVLSLPRWQSLVVLCLTLLFFIYIYFLFVTY